MTKESERASERQGERERERERERENEREMGQCKRRRVTVVKERREVNSPKCVCICVRVRMKNTSQFVIMYILYIIYQIYITYEREAGREGDGKGYEVM